MNTAYWISNWIRSSNTEYKSMSVFIPRSNTAYSISEYGVLVTVHRSKKEKMVDEHHKEVQKASTSKGAESPMNDATRDESENESSSGSEDPNS
ncbi:hypothetical protein Tco_1408168 [Tanacetum coccineum]